jgi:hypothetical protein
MEGADSNIVGMAKLMSAGKVVSGGRQKKRVSGERHILYLRRSLELGEFRRVSGWDVGVG